MGFQSLASSSLLAGQQIEGLSVQVQGTTGLRASWDAPPSSVLFNLEEFEVMVVREGRGQVVASERVFLFSNSFVTAQLSPGVSYRVVLRGLYREGITGLNSTVIVTTEETGEYCCSVS